MLSIQMAKFLGSPVNPMAKDKKVDPAKINAIMHDVFVAPSSDRLNVSLLRLF